MGIGVIYKSSEGNTMDDDAWLTRCVVDTTARTFYLYSSDGDTRTVTCETTEQFIDVLNLCRSLCGDDVLVYSEPTVSKL